MITHDDMEDFMFVESELKGYYHSYKYGVRVHLEDGKIKWIGEGDNYHGLSINIRSMPEFKLFLMFLK